MFLLLSFFVRRLEITENLECISHFRTEILKPRSWSTESALTSIGRTFVLKSPWRKMLINI